jgi:hypothetical protein
MIPSCGEYCLFGLSSPIDTHGGQWEQGTSCSPTRAHQPPSLLLSIEMAHCVVSTLRSLRMGKLSIPFGVPECIKRPWISPFKGLMKDNGFVLCTSIGQSDVLLATHIPSRLCPAANIGTASGKVLILC